MNQANSSSVHYTASKSVYPDLSPNAPPPYNAIPNQAYPAQQHAIPMDNRNLNEQKFRDIINKYEISRLFADKLQFLFSFKIVFIFDDSGSMNSILKVFFLKILIRKCGLFFLENAKKSQFIL